MTKELSGADANIFKKKDELCPQEFVVENIVVPKADYCPFFIVSYGPGRSGSTGLFALMASQSEIGASFYQPFKTIMRHGLLYGRLEIPNTASGVTHVFAKDVGGPFHKEEEFDPVGLLTAAGFPQDKILFVPLMRDPLATFKSNLKFSGGIKPEILIGNVNFTLGLYEKYKSVIPVVPLAYDLCEFGVEAVMRSLFARLGVRFDGLKFDPSALTSFDKGGKISLGEAAQPEEYEEIIKPTFARGEFRYVADGRITPKMFAGFMEMPGAEGLSADTLVGQAQLVDQSCTGKYEAFYAQSAETLGIQLPASS